jgi:HK97 family phage prohead protease
METYDFGGVATAYDVRCKDGRVIQQGAFDHQKGETVPIVWRHGHKDIRNVLGHALLSVGDQPPGMRVKARFNQSKEGQRAKQLVQDEDIKALSIWANELIEHETKEGRAVEKGRIREVSLVVTGMNPGAQIDDVVRHSDDPNNPNWVDKDGVIIHTEHELELFVEEEEEVEEVEEVEEETEEVVEHQEEADEDETVKEIYKTLNEAQIKLFDVVIHAAGTGETLPPGGSTEKGGPTLKEVFDSLSDKQRDVLYYMTGQVSQEESVSQGDTDMPKTHNIFEESVDQEKDVHLAHENLNAAMATAQKGRVSSLREAFRQHDVTIDSLHILAQEQPEFLSHSITNISNFFPKAKAVDPGGPQYLANEPTAWVGQVLNGVRQVPWARLKSNYADLTGEDARAKGYVTGAQKVEEVIVALQRETTPQTIYKLQKLERDNIIDITEFDVVVWLKAEMRMMLQEEVARAILISDGRAAGADKIVETNVRPIYNDAATYTISRIYNDIGNEDDFANWTAAEFIAFVDYVAESFDDYRGAGSPVFFCQQSLLSKLMTVRDSDNHRLHVNKADLADQLGVSSVVPVPVMNGMERTDEIDPTGLPTGTYDIATLGVIVNLRDYSVGRDRGGEVNFFDDFDIDYNKYTYLYETRMSGALTNPKSAIAIELVTAKTA